MIPYLVCVGTALLFAAGNVLLIKSSHGKEIGQQPDLYWLLAAIFVFDLALYIHSKVVMAFGATKATGLVDGLLTVFTLGLVLWFFPEPLTKNMYIGLIFVGIGIWLLK